MKWLLAFFLCTLVFGLSVTAHVLDEYVQAALITLARDDIHVELRLTPGVQVADRVFRLIDVDGNKQISSLEEQAYAQRVIRDLSVELDGKVTSFNLLGVHVPTQSELRGGSSAIRLELQVKTAWEKDGEHQLVFTNRHLPQMSAYLANVLAPATETIKITEQQRDKLQHNLRVSFLASPEAHNALLNNSQNVVSSSAHVWTDWGIALLAVSFLTIVIAQWKRLNKFFRRTVP